MHLKDLYALLPGRKKRPQELDDVRAATKESRKVSYELEQALEDVAQLLKGDVKT